jgi:hypothetical protein
MPKLDLVERQNRIMKDPRQIPQHALKSKIFCQLVSVSISDPNQCSGVTSQAAQRSQAIVNIATTYSNMRVTVMSPSTDST